MVNQFPPEILEKIFVEVELGSLSNLPVDLREEFQTPDWLRSGQDWVRVYQGYQKAFRKFSHSHTSLVPLLTVCRLWHDLAERQLYQCVSVDDRLNDGLLHRLSSDDGRMTEGVLYKLSSTLQANDRLAGLVRHLRLHSDTPESQVQAQIIARCRNMTRLTIIGGDGWENDVLRGAVGRVRGLKSLVFVREENPFGLIPRGQTPSVICTEEELFKWLSVWPEMEYIAIYDIVQRQGPPESMNDVVALTKEGSILCPRLHSFLANKSLKAPHFRALATIAPSLTSLDTFVKPSTIEDVIALADTLPVWALGLRNLAIRYPLSTPRPKTDYIFTNDLCKQLRHIESLRVPASLVRPESLIHFADVVQLGYISASPSEVERLASIVPSLKNLKELHLRVPEVDTSGPGLQLLKAVCTAQGIDFSCLNDWHEYDNL